MSRKFNYEWLLPYSHYIFATKNGVWCKVCDNEIKCTRKSNIDDHVQRKWHLQEQQESIVGPAKHTMLHESEVLNRILQLYGT